METEWRVINHIRYFRDSNNVPLRRVGFTLKKLKKGGKILFVSDVLTLDTTEQQNEAYLFVSKEAAEQFMDKMNAFERMKIKWLDQAFL